MLNHKIAGTVQFSESQLQAADCCLDGEVNAEDALTLLKFLVRLIFDIPVGA